MTILLFFIALESSYFLKMSPGVTSQGLGGSSVVVNEGLAVFHNPAYVERTLYNFTLSRWLYSTNYLTLGGNHDRYSFGLSYMNYGSIQGYDRFGAPTIVFTPYNACMGIGRRFGVLGIALKAFIERVAEQTQYGIAGCLGFSVRTGKLQLGAKVDNLGKEFAQGTAIPSYTAVGIKIGLTQEIDLIAEAKYPELEFNSGLAYSYRDLTILFGGRYIQNGTGQMVNHFDNIGVTGGLVLAMDNYRIGYSIVYGYLSLAHQFSVTFAP